MKLDIVAFGAHPDDVELSCAGTLLSHIAMGKKVGIVDLTRGELGTRGTPEIRDQEAAAAAKILGIHARENLGFADGFFVNDRTHQIEIIRALRTYQPDIVLATALYDRHPDHGRSSGLIAEACFLSGLAKIVTVDKGGIRQLPWRPKRVYNYIQDIHIEPHIVVDISDFIDQKMESVKAYGSQFYNPDSPSDEPETYISNKLFFDRLYTRANEMGRRAGFDYAEGFTTVQTLGVKNLFDLS